MARGYSYYIMSNVMSNNDTDVTFGAGNYYEDLDSLGIEWVEDVDEEKSKEPLEWLADTMSRLGAAVYFSCGSNDFVFSFKFSKVEKAQQDWFKPKLEKLKNEAAKLTLSDIIRSEHSLDYIQNDNYGDMITMNDGFSDINMTVDDFIRQLKPGVFYYVYKKTVLMH